MSIAVVIILIVLGIILLLVEFLIIPGITIAGIGAFLLLAVGIFFGYYDHGATVGNYITLGTVFIVVVTFALIFKSRTWKHMGLTATIDSKIDVVKVDNVKVGSAGKTISKLSPIGKAIFGKLVVEVRSDGEYINSKTNIIVTRIEGNKLFVQETKKKE